MNALLKPLACAALLTSAFASTGYAQTTSTTTAVYPYSVSLSVTKPKGSAAELALKNKALPVGVNFSPCNPAIPADAKTNTSAVPNMDQLAFTIKYDAGKSDSDLQNVYLIFSHPDTGLTKDAKPYLALVRNNLGNNIEFKAYATPAGTQGIQRTDTYAAANNNLGYAQTEVIFGGNIALEGLSSGLWLLTAIIADSATVNFDDPSTWSAWDTVPFMLRKPWRGDTAYTAAVCQ